MKIVACATEGQQRQQSSASQQPKSASPVLNKAVREYVAEAIDRKIIDELALVTGSERDRSQADFDGDDWVLDLSHVIRRNQVKTGRTGQPARLMVSDGALALNGGQFIDAHPTEAIPVAGDSGKSTDVLRTGTVFSQGYRGAVIKSSELPWLDLDALVHKT